MTPTCAQPVACSSDHQASDFGFLSDSPGSGDDFPPPFIRSWTLRLSRPSANPEKHGPGDPSAGGGPSLQSSPLLEVRCYRELQFLSPMSSAMRLQAPETASPSDEEESSCTGRSGILMSTGPEDKRQGRQSAVDGHSGLVPARQFLSSAKVKVLRHAPPAQYDQALVCLVTSSEWTFPATGTPQARRLRPQAFPSGSAGPPLFGTLALALTLAPGSSSLALLMLSSMMQRGRQR
ncbi:hypothetical protein FDECE_15287 [Fusarium decemcellulare]|nr:hypothetical protein FDECE_15287 [Fusarium decemcellulare]